MSKTIYRSNLDRIFEQVYYEESGNSNNDFIFDVKKCKKGLVIIAGNLSFTISGSAEFGNPQNFAPIKSGNITDIDYEGWHFPWSFIKISIISTSPYEIWVKGSA